MSACDGMYKLLDDEGACDSGSRGPAADGGARPGPPVRLTPRPSLPGPYRLSTICLATLCVVLLISLIAVTAHYKNKPQGGGEATSEQQKQTQEANVTALTAAITKLRQEKDQLQKEKDELLAKMATKAPEVIKPTTKAMAAPVCPPDWLLFDNSCYFISRNTRSWSESQSFCESKGGHLAIITTAKEQRFLWNLLPRGHWNAFWFGITDAHTEDTWKWVDGSPLVQSFWEEGEPNNHVDEDCGYIVKTRVLTRVATRSWYDAPCTMYWSFICEKEMGAANTTTTTTTTTLRHNKRATLL